MSSMFQRHPWVLTAITSMMAAAVASVATVYLTREHFHSHAGDSESDFHQWLHSNLEISEAKEALLHPLEEEYERERKRLRSEILKAGNAIAEAVKSAGKPSDDLDRALEQLAAAQRELQAVSLKHFFDMKQHLEPEQAERLLEWTHDSIINEHTH